eukprot:CAMPEP_0201922824 /NCGR_PEP_ID=MMETSP0903-20130614/10747_1 /ASSEMBLY_ACC=CAM_ASM_000552 /TAXON_ID=420261 /ORGANISM="Thalassiosira antarctica, Strain CCMP982" /LENGTH=623 /DNA_ID=CAMNT_0048460029 /DNA_START=36 /DNA_END=1907 /DNA_ORIENTATION=+
MSRSPRPSQPQQQPPQRQQQERLRNEAISHGPYLWSNRDVENALLWFHPNNGNNEASSSIIKETNNDIINNGDEGSDFLRCLLQARGIGMHRPLPHRSQRSSSNNKKRTKKSIGGSISGKSKSSLEMIGQHENEKGGRKRCRKMVNGGGGDETTQSSPLQAVIMGYYQLFLPSTSSSSSTSSSTNDGHSQSSSKGNNGNGNNDDTGHFTTLDMKHAEMASSKLLGDLSSIISARRHTNDIYQAFSNVVVNNREDDGNNAKRAEKIMPRTSPAMSQTIDEYMTHPTTCVRRVYASSLFDRLLNLCRGVVPEDITATTNYNVDGIIDNENNDNNPALHNFLQKLVGLATANVKIQEVVLLLLLEPVRRLQLLQCQKEEGQPEEQSQLMLSQQLQMTQEEDTMQHLQEPRQKEQQSRGSMDPSPLLTSISFWSDISAETIERVCTGPPLPILVQFILQTSPIDDDTNLAYATTFTASASKGDKHNPTRTIEWWSLPSPLLCTISQWYFPIACKYIRYWIQLAMIGHDKLYYDTPTKQQQQQQSSNDSSLATNSNVNHEGVFQHAILRIKQFCSTSERLHLLGSHILHSMEKESQESLEMCVVVSEEGENAAFRKSLAWKAIYRHVF